MSLAADLVVLPYDLVKPVFYEECRWNWGATDGIGMPLSSLERAVMDIAKKDQLDASSASLLNKKVKFLSTRLGHLNERRIEEFLQTLHHDLTPREELEEKLIEMSSKFQCIHASIFEVSRFDHWSSSINDSIDAARHEYYYGSLRDGTRRLEALASFFRGEMLNVDREFYTFNWAFMHFSSGVLDSALGWQYQDTARIDQAILSLRAAQKVFTRDKYPKSWAHIQWKIGNALWKSGSIEKETNRLQSAVRTYETALEVVKLDRRPRLWTVGKTDFGLRWIVGQPEDEDYEWAPIELELALAYLTLHEETDSSDAYDHGINHYQSALQGLSERKLYRKGELFFGYLPILDLSQHVRE